MTVAPGSVVIVAGPTACGKSALAMDLAEAFRGTVINADSMQVYAELRILTARPDAADEARVPHRLYGVLPMAEVCSAGRWLAMASDAIKAAWAGGRLPVVVGGTGLYLKALRHGIASVPEVPATVRDEARALHERLGGAAFAAELAGLDAEAAARLPVGDRQRLIRAYEVAKATGRTLGAWQRQAPAVPPLAARFETIVLMPPRDVVYAAAEARFEDMMAKGALDEAAAVLALGLDRELPAMKAVGLRQLGRHLRGETGLDEARVAARRATRNYAKRQLTWLRHQGAGGRLFSAQYSERIREEIFSIIRQFLLTGGA